VVELDGSLSNFEIMHRAHPLLDEEALRIIKSMPPWRPAVYKGENDPPGAPTLTYLSFDLKSLEDEEFIVYVNTYDSMREFIFKVD